MKSRADVRRLAATALVACLCLLPPMAGAATPDDNGSGVARARALLSVEDANKLRNQSIPQLYRLSKDDRPADFYRSVWQLDRAANPDLPWDLLARADVRIAFAQMWGQYVRNTTGNKAEIAATRAYADRFMREFNLKVRADAVAFLGALGTAADIPQLVEVCATDALPVAINAAYSIRTLARKDASSYLEQCLTRTQSDEVGKAVRSIMKEP